MIYANPGEKSRNLRRMWEIKVYVGADVDKEKKKKKPRTKKETIIAWNHVDAIRRAGAEVAELPVSLGFVTWPPIEDPEADVYFIESPKVGPTNKKAKPSLSNNEDEWNF